MLRWRGRQAQHAALQRRLASLGATTAAFSRHFLGSGVTGPQLAASLHVRPAPPPGDGDPHSAARAPPADVRVQVGARKLFLCFTSAVQAFVK